MTLVKIDGKDVSQPNTFSLVNGNSIKLHPISGLFKEHNGQAFDIETRLPIHPRNKIGGCVAVSAGKLQDGKSALLIESNPSSDFIENWNTGKYRTSYIEGRAVFAGENPELFNKVASVTGYSFKPDVIVWLDKIIAADENALPVPQKSKTLIEVRTPAEGEPLITLK
jgi:hypothetical protein